MDVVVTLGPDQRKERLRLHGVTAGGSYREPKTYVTGRVCMAESCSTILSRYNRSTRCWQHEPAREYFGPVRGRRSTPVQIRDLTA